MLLYTFLLAAFTALGSCQCPQGVDTPDCSEYDIYIGASAGQCKDLYILYARGTWMGGNFDQPGSGSWARDIAQQVGDQLGISIGLQGIASQFYPALWENTPQVVVDTKSAGNRVSDLVGIVVEKCPSSEVSLIGYSQGGIVMHQAAWAMTQAARQDRISSLVVFGDALTLAIPDRADSDFGALSGKAKNFCNTLDDKGCSPPGPYVGDHGSYGQDVPDAVSFIVSQYKA